MALVTDIKYCDSSLSLMSGCDGCELWGGVRRTCYAGRIMAEYPDNPNFPKRFEEPQIFPKRVDKVLEWSNLTGKNRKNATWLNGFPRVIMLNNMGDTFTRELPLEWMAEYIPLLEGTPHIYLVLTKRVERMAEFCRIYGKIPDNIWLGASVTEKATAKRADILAGIQNVKTLFLSIEPMVSNMSFSHLYPKIRWVVAGFESGKNCRPGNVRNMTDMMNECKRNNIPFFVNQMGGVKSFEKRDELNDIPKGLRVRQMPAWEHLDWAGKDAPASSMQLTLI